MKKCFKSGTKVKEGFIYGSDNNTEWMSITDLQSWIEANENNIDKI